MCLYHHVSGPLLFWGQSNQLIKNLFFSWHAFDNKPLLIAMMDVVDTGLKKWTKSPWREENSLLSYKAQKCLQDAKSGKDARRQEGLAQS